MSANSDNSLNDLHDPTFPEISPAEMNVLVEESQRILNTILHDQINGLFADDPSSSENSSQLPISTF